MTEARVRITFLTSRVHWFIPTLVFLRLCLVPVWAGFHFGLSGNLMSGIIGGAIGLSLVACFAAAEHLTRYAITIEPDVVSLQREFQGIPVARKTLYARVLVTDLGIRPVEDRSQSGPIFKVGDLCIWVDGKSVAIEPYFPIAEGVCLANDLRTIGIVFPQTYPSYSPGINPSLMRVDYFSF